MRSAHLLLSMALLAECGGGDSPDAVACASDDTFPLQVDNRWTWTVGRSPGGGVGDAHRRDHRRGAIA
jgi:hypothetical protein